MFFSICHSGVAGFALQRCSQCQRLHPGVRHLLCGELWIRQDDQAADSGAQVRSTAVSDHATTDTQLIKLQLWFLMTSASRPVCRQHAISQPSPATKPYNYTLVTVIDSLLVVISFNSAHSSLHPDSLVMTFDSSIAAWEHDLKIIFRLFMLLLKSSEIQEAGEAEGDTLKVWSLKGPNSREKKDQLKGITCSTVLAVGIPAYIYILKGATSGLVCSAMLCVSELPPCRSSSPSCGSKCVTMECLWPMTENHYHQHLGREGWMQEEGKTEEWVIIGQRSKVTLEDGRKEQRRDRYCIF